MDMDVHHVEDVRSRDKHHHQQLVRERGQRIKAAADLGLARSSHHQQLQLAPKEATTPLLGRGCHGDDEEGDDDEVVVEEKVALLRRLVPGGEGMAVEGLLEETADYIAALKAQVGVMRALTRLLSAGSDLDGDAPRPELSAAGVLLTPVKPV